MRKGWRVMIVVIFLAGFFLTGLIGTSAAMTFIWPAYLLLGLAGLLSIGGLFTDVSFKMPVATTVTIFALVAYLMIRAAESPVAYFAREDAALVVSGFMVYAGFLMLCSSNRLRLGLVLTLATLVLANLFLALGQKLLDPGLSIIPGYERTHNGVGGLFNQPDHFASFIAVTVPLWFGFAAFGRHKKMKRMAWLAFGLLNSVVVCFSGSTLGKMALAAGMIAFFVLFLTVLWKHLKPEVRCKGIIGLGFVPLLGAVGLYLASGPIYQGLGSELFSRGGQSSLPFVSEAATKKAVGSPWFGNGSRSSYVHGHEFLSEALDSKSGEPEFAYNSFLQVFADYGIIGFALLLAALVAHFYNGFIFIKAYSEVNTPPGDFLPRSHHLALALGAMASLVALSCLAFFDSALHLPAFAVTGTVLLAVMALPDPMSSALNKKKTAILPGGSFVSATRAIVFGCGIAMVGMGILYTRAEYHCEMARIAFEVDSQDFKPLRHLQTARELDPVNPFVHRMSAQAQVAGITSQMSDLERRQALEKADFYFKQARRLYSQDVYAAIGHAAVLDELGQRSLARERLNEARGWTPFCGNLMMAKAEHHLRYGEINEAELAFENAVGAFAFQDYKVALEGLKTISGRKLIEEQDSLNRNSNSGSQIASDQGRREMRSAWIDRRLLAGEIKRSQDVPGVGKNED